MWATDYQLISCNFLFVVHSNVINAAAPLEEIRQKFPSAKDRAKKRKEDAKAGLVDLVNAPERAAKLVRDAHDKTTIRKPYITDDAAYRRFVREGARVTDGSYVEDRSARLHMISSNFLPRNLDSKLVAKLQR